MKFIGNLSVSSPRGSHGKYFSFSAGEKGRIDHSTGLRNRRELLEQIDLSNQAMKTGETVCALFSITLADQEQHQRSDQNEELIDAHQMISSLLTQYTNLYDFAPCGYITLSPKGIISQINLNGAALLGEDRLPLTNESLNNFIEKSSKSIFSRTTRC